MFHGLIWVPSKAIAFGFVDMNYFIKHDSQI